MDTNKVKRPQRFPDIDWYCDYCHSYLNAQEGFDDNHRVWKCVKCGYKNKISEDQIREESPFIPWLGECILYVGSFLSYLLIAMLVTGLIRTNLNDWKLPIIYAGSTLLLWVVFSIVFERGIAKYHQTFFVTVTEPFVFLFKTIFMPFVQIGKLVKYYGKIKLNQNKEIIARTTIFAILNIVLILFEILLFLIFMDLIHLPSWRQIMEPSILIPILIAVIVILVISLVISIVKSRKSSKRKETIEATNKKLMSDALREGSSAAGKAMAARKKMKNQNK